MPDTVMHSESSRPPGRSREESDCASDFTTLLFAFECGYQRLGREDDWRRSLYRWAYVMGRRQSKGARP